jgi:formate hydrogenlyase subunit 3/multisubunit Na+/H+ antiporter MnhD subunit
MHIFFSSLLSKVLFVQLILLVGIFLLPITRWVWHIPASKKLNIVVLYGVVGIDIDATLLIVFPSLFRNSLQTTGFAFGFAFIWALPGLIYLLYTIRKHKKNMRRKYHEAFQRINSR